MIAAIMQPYFFPYIGYFQLMHAVDVFVFYDDVQYMKGGWVNRNRIRSNDRATWLTIPVERIGLSSLINERHYLIDEATIAGIMVRLEANYCGAPAYAETVPWVRELLHFGDTNVAAFNANLLKTLARKFNSNCRVLMSSTIEKPSQLKGEERVVDICRRIGANHYLNAAGGIDLYHEATFEQAGIQLSFLRTIVEPTRLVEELVHLSILDTLMHEGFSGCASLMTRSEIFVRPTISSESE